MLEGIKIKYVILILAFLILPIFICRADDSDDTLKFYLSKSELVVIGKITTDIFVKITESGVPNYGCDFEIQDVIKGDESLKEKTIRVHIQRLEMDKEDKHPLIKKDSKCILFLNKIADNPLSYRTSDVWFGIQHPFPMMIKSLKRLAKEK